ncbi:MAG: energy transducer TonB [Bacteroidetes Order II. Incertae sedis bacterium]|nr:energy transducer TonB [Bacteroidetes Order II. bacterium]
MTKQRPLIFLFLFAFSGLQCSLLGPQTETPPQFPGGETQLGEHIGLNLRYPDAAYQAGTEGTVIVEFYVERNGDISNITLKQGVSPELDEEAIKLIQNMPPWVPGMRGRTKVRSRMTLPVNFTIKRV